MKLRRASIFEFRLYLRGLVVTFIIGWIACRFIELLETCLVELVVKFTEFKSIRITVLNLIIYPKHDRIMLN